MVSIIPPPDTFDGNLDLGPEVVVAGNEKDLTAGSPLHFDVK